MTVDTRIFFLLPISMNSKLIYIADIRLPTDKAHGIQIMKMCEAFASQEQKVELWVPRRHTPITESPFLYYQVKHNFEIQYLRCLDLTRFGRLGFFFQTSTFALHALLRSFFQNSTVFFTRDPNLALLLRFARKEVTWESHMGQLNIATKLLIKTKVKMVHISQGLFDVYKKHGALPKRMIVASDAVDIDQFHISLTKNEAREKIGLKKDQHIVLYTGHLYSWKGADVLAEATRILPSTIHTVFVGGTDHDIQNFKHRYGAVENISIIGKKPHSEMPLYMRAADVLVIPNSAKEDISRLYTSPMKLFEYMASGTPIVASNLPSLREVVGGGTSFLFESDDAVSLAKEIETVFQSPEVAEQKAQLAFEKVQAYSWNNRAKQILTFLNM